MCYNKGEFSEAEGNTNLYSKMWVAVWTKVIENRNLIESRWANRYWPMSVKFVSGFTFSIAVPANTKHFYNIKRWSNIVQML